MTDGATKGSELARHWTLDPSIDFLNHGSFGACPRVVLEHQAELRAELEREPVTFLVRNFTRALDLARERLAAFVGADPAGLVFVKNATQGVNGVLGSLAFAPGDEILVTDHEYAATQNTAQRIAARAGARLVTAKIPFPGATRDIAVDSVLAAAGPRTVLAILDHVTSPSGLVLPVERIVPALAERGIDCLIDGAHAPGMVPLALDRLGAAYYTANCHKWLCAPKGAALLYVRADRRDRIHPACTSHGYTFDRSRHGRYLVEHDWTGTDDLTPWLCVDVAIAQMARLVPGGWDEIMRHNRALALRSREILGEALGVAPPCPDDMIGSLAAMPLPAGTWAGATAYDQFDPLQDALLFRHRIEVPIITWPAFPGRWVRTASQLYNDLAQSRRLGAALVAELGRGL